MHWRRLVRVLHRDVGYFLTGLVILYCISGIAVNHIGEWNPNYATTVEQVDVGPLDGAALDTLQSQVVSRLELDPDDVANSHRPTAGEFVVFLPHGGKASIDPRTGKGTLKRVSTRPVIFESNVLHLNHLKGIWTWVSDAFAVLLLGLAVTGLFMLKGRKGLGGRGKWFVGAGMVVPIAALWVYYATR